MTRYEQVRDLEKRLSDLCHQLWLADEEFGHDSEEYLEALDNYYEVYRLWEELS